jgi:hypothetical protein
MTSMSDFSAAPGDSPKPVESRRPKRGAFPTPKSEIQKAKPYVPDISEKDDPEEKPDLPEDVKGESETDPVPGSSDPGE